MNIKYHASIGIIGSFITKDPLFFIASVVPDVVLVYNEIKLFLNKNVFDEKKVDKISLNLYYTTHSFITSIAMLFCFGPVFFIGYFLHLFCDIFTHVGLFSLKPLYPFNQWSFKCGKNILK
jgi:membrane-bound metal-dependent hydrolase YbcI (DUF457 family)